MKIELRPELEIFAERRARELGCASVDEYIGRLVDQERRAATDRTSRGWRAVERMTGKSTSGMSTDEVMKLMRDEES